MLRSHCQPCGDQGALCYATRHMDWYFKLSDEGSLFSCIVITVICVKCFVLSYIMNPVATERVAVYCGLLSPAEKFPFPRHTPSCAIPSRAEPKTAGFGPVCSHQPHLNDSHKAHEAHETKFVSPFKLFCALPRTINLYNFQSWYPREIRSFIAAGANHYVATFDETTVLKFPVAPREEQMKYPAEG